MALTVVPIEKPEPNETIVETFEVATRKIDNMVAVAICYVERDGSSTVLYHAASDIVTLIGASALLTQRLVTAKED